MFLLKPLSHIFKGFLNPATSAFFWVRSGNAETLFLNGFRQSPQVTTWHDLLLLLENEPFHFSVLKTHYAVVILLTYYTPIFATSLSELQFIKSDTLPYIGTDVMKVKSQIFTIPTKRNFHMLKDFFSRRNKKKQTFRNITHLEVGNWYFV